MMFFGTSALVAASLVTHSIASAASFSRTQRATGDCSIGNNKAQDPRAAFFRGVVEASNYGSHEKVPSAAGCPLKVGIVGAGAAGLYAAILLDSLGIDYDIYEASDRIGGRIYTYRFSESEDPEDPAYYDYYDVGAMRFPNMTYMDRVIGEQSCALIPYINNLKPTQSQPVNKIHYAFTTNDTFRLFNGVLAYNQEGTSPSTFDVDLGNTTFDDLDSGSLWLKQVSSMTTALTLNFDTGFDKLMEAYDSLSARAYLLSQGYTNGQINWLETVNDATDHYDTYSMSQAVLEQWIFSSTNISQWTAINGGMGKLTDGMCEVIKNKPIFNSRVTKIGTNSDGTMNLVVNGTKQTYAHVISTVPLGALQVIDMSELGLNYFEKSAIRQLQYDPAMKIGMKFKSRWWESLPSGSFQGGQSYTDLPIRRPVYPSYGLNVPGAPGTMIASYTWGQDASRLGAYLNPHNTPGQNPSQPDSFDHLVKLTLADMALLHNVTFEFLWDQYEDAHAYDWYQSENTVGAFAIFAPGQFSSMMPYLMTPAAKGHMHFGGEALSSGHAWIIGAVNSAYRNVVEILATEQLNDKLDELVAKWGLIDEVDMGWYNWTSQVSGVSR